ncbi:KEOPS complex subunit Cgi121 [Geoglobus sp.]
MRIYQGKIRVENLRDFLSKIPDGCVLVNADYVVDIDTVRFAAEKALKMWEGGRRVARTLSMEVLLHIAATRQINQALKIGVREGENSVVVVDICGCRDLLESLGFEEQNVLRMDEEKVRRISDFYGISDEELRIVGASRIGLLVRERMALFAVSK